MRTGGTTGILGGGSRWKDSLHQRPGAKHVEQPKPASPDTGLRHGKIASALELAQAFSRSFSDRKLAGRCSGQRSLPGNVSERFVQEELTASAYAQSNSLLTVDFVDPWSASSSIVSGGSNILLEMEFLE
ncbi:hypothetical protein OIU74_006725 [Salix koriyanagi]|uniref:Uncharacterized protein n=1 Tax=Salix koriyanagi TaxID=2511006 RepID=A0A9Q0ZBX8_9ROSI|nr:hypothetical protein OIU74_006725 [Salix koriyanagi]